VSGWTTTALLCFAAQDRATRRVMLGATEHLA